MWVLSLALVYRRACLGGNTHHIDWTLVYEIILKQNNFVSRRFSLYKTALCQLQWVDEKLTPREDELRSLFLYVQSNQNPFFKVFKVPETKGISLNEFDEIIGSFQFGVGIRQFHGV